MSPSRPLLLLTFLLVAVLAAQEATPGAVEGVKGVRQEGSGKVREVDPASKQVPPPPSPGVREADAPKAVESPKAVASPPVKAVPSPAAKSAEQAKEAAPPPPAQGVKAVDGTKPPESVQGPGVKLVKPTDAKASPPPPTGQGVHKVEGQKPPEPVKGAGQGVPPPPAVKPVAPPAPGTVAAPAEVKPPAGIKPVPGVTGIDTEKQRNLEAALQAKPAAADPKKAKAAAGLLQGPPAKPKAAEKADDRRLFEEARKIPDNGS